MIVETKGCTRCKRNRPLKDFRVLPNGKLFSWCNFCFALKEQARKAARRNNRKMQVTLPNRS